MSKLAEAKKRLGLTLEQKEHLRLLISELEVQSALDWDYSCPWSRGVSETKEQLINELCGKEPSDGLR